MLDLTTEFGARVNKRLLKEDIIWFTTVSSRGIPASNPVWFLWDGETIIVYSEPKSHRIRNIQNNPNVTLHLQGVDGLGNNVVIIKGQASLTFNNRIIPTDYWNKYAKFLEKMTPDEMIAAYNVEIRVNLLKVRGE